MTRRKSICAMMVLVLFAAWITGRNILIAADDAAPFVDKTLVVWAAPETLDQHGGSALTIDMANPDAFDAVVFGEIQPSVWMPGSTAYKRTSRDQADWPKVTKPGEWVRVAICYSGKRVTIYSGDHSPISYEMESSPQPFDLSATIFIGQRHDAERRDVFIGRIRDARIYDVALSAEQVTALEPGKPLEGITPWAWWDFTDGLYEKTGRFNNVLLDGDASIENDALVLGKQGGLFCAQATGAKRIAQQNEWSSDKPVPAEVLKSARTLREKFLADPHRPLWHFCLPEDNGMPGDPNGCFYANGRYHLMYLYNRTGSSFCWGHLSSVDLLHWRHHPDAIGPGEGDSGCFSGGGFVDDDGTAWISYWMLPGERGVGIASSMPPYDMWTKSPNNPAVAGTDFGLAEVETPNGKLLYGAADPSNIWKKDGHYYMLTGNLPVLNKYGRGAEVPDDIQGDRLFLFKSSDLKSWDYNGVFYQRRNEWTDPSEDNMCPSFLPLPKSRDGGEPSGKYLLLFISHNKGCQYYIGTYDQEHDRFLPESHGRMTWVDNTYFAPEALLDGQGRQIMWAWLLDNRDNEIADGWSGVYGLPRTLWLGDDGTLRMAPVTELESLRLGEQIYENIALDTKGTVKLENVPGDSCEVEVVFTAEEVAKADKIGVIVRHDAERGEKTVLYYDRKEKTLSFDSRSCQGGGRPVLESAPLELKPDENLTLRVFVDHSIVEVYANDRQAICRRVYPTRPEKAMGLNVFAEPSSTETLPMAKTITTWEIAPSNPY